MYQSLLHAVTSLFLSNQHLIFQAIENARHTWNIASPSKTRNGICNYHPDPGTVFRPAETVYHPVGKRMVVPVERKMAVHRDILVVLHDHSDHLHCHISFAILQQSTQTIFRNHEPSFDKTSYAELISAIFILMASSSRSPRYLSG
jgi:hypothetical protein